MDTGHPQPSAEFAAWLSEALRRAGFRSATALGRASGVDPSIINRWLRQETVPTAAKLIALAPHLRVEEADLFAAAFGTEDRPPPKPLPAAFDNLADEYDLADEDAKALIVEQVRRITEWARWRRERR
jgi:transcriptional regulator with XRE-family HTH domain